MYIVHLVGSLERGGAEVFLTQLVAGIAAREPAWRQSVWTLSADGPLAPAVRNSGAGVRAFHVAKSPAGLVRVAKLARALADEPCSLLQCWMYHAEVVGLLAHALGSRAPQVWSVRQSRLTADANNAMTRALMRLCAWGSARVPAAIVANSMAALAAHRTIGYRAPLMPVIHNGVDVARFGQDSALREQQRRSWGVHDGTVLIGYLARVAPVKGHADLFAAVARIATASAGLPPWRLVCVGTGTTPEDRAFAGMVREAGIGDRVIAAGPSANPAAVLSAFDIAVSSSRGEGFPNGVAESLASGLPMVATDVGDTRALVGDTSYLVPPGDPEALSAALLTMLRLSVDQRRALGAAGRERIRHGFRLDDAVDAYAALYRHVASAAPEAAVGPV